MRKLLLLLLSLVFVVLAAVGVREQFGAARVHENQSK